VLSDVFTGYWTLDDADVSSKKWTPPSDLLEFIGNAHKQGKKVVYIGFGSIVVPDPKKMTRCVVQAVVRSGVHAILSKGWSDRLYVKKGETPEPEEPLPPQIYPVSAIPHDWLFQRIDAACHHGGAGTTGASLRGIVTLLSRCPMLIATLFQLVFLLLSTHSLVTNSFGLTESRLLVSALVFESLQSIHFRMHLLLQRLISSK
jgi:hypothetical protein